MSERYARIAVSGVTYWVDRPYDYLVPESLCGRLCPGMRVVVPFSQNNRRSEGIVLEISDSLKGGCDPKKIKYIKSILDQEPILTQGQIKMALWMRERFFCTVYDAVRAILPAGLWFDAAGKRRVSDKLLEYARLTVSGEEAHALSEGMRGAAMQRAVLRLLSAVGEASVPELRELTGASRQSIKALEDKSLIELYKKQVLRRPHVSSRVRLEMPKLNAEQQEAFSGLLALSDRHQAACALLFGVTGSGKTAVYISLINEVLSSGRDAMLLVPEIALTPQMLETFSSYFGENIAVLHSSLSMTERYEEWKRIKSGAAHLVIGTRSAVFAPCESLGLIIIDEEQEETYKSENSPRYHARDIAKYRCAESNALLVLGSATPDIESRYAAETGKYAFFRLNSRYNRRPLPKVRIVDMKRELRAGNNTSISAALRGELEENIACGQQSILFINRRGASKLITCVDCGYNFKCPNCSVSLTYHSYGNRLMCHYCGHSQRVPAACPECGGELSFIGDGTQRVEQQLGELFPETPVMRMDTDTVARSGSHEELLDRFRREKIPIMIGTQMVTKGLNFEDVTLVGVINADQRLYSGNYRDAERTFSLITQVIGRGGRAESEGRAIIQTFTPDNQVIRLAARQDYEGFFRQEIELRRMQKCPPFTQIIALTAAGGDEQTVLRCCGYIRALLERELGSRVSLSILGPAPYPVVRVKGQFRYKISLACEPDREIRSLISRLLIYCNTDKNFRGVSVYADMNPSD